MLKNLNHPNIVSFRGSFIDKGVLIIVMEFCECKHYFNNLLVGDLAFHIKKLRSKGETLTETEIMNYFI